MQLILERVNETEDYETWLGDAAAKNTIAHKEPLGAIVTGNHNC